MKIITIVRTRNEHRNIERFCRSYSWADQIFVADGGSDDDTISLASKFPNVIVRLYLERVFGKKEIWRNKQGKIRKTNPKITYNGFKKSTRTLCSLRRNPGIT